MKALFLLLLLLVSISVSGQQPFLKDIWLNENHVPVKINVLLKDDKGYLYAGTDMGLYRFNGSTFKKMADEEQSPVTALSLHRNTIWIGYKSGKTGLVSKDSIILFRDHRTPFSSAISSIKPFPDGTFWLGTEQGITIVSKDRVKNYTSKNGLSDDFIYSLNFSGNKHILAGTDQGINDFTLANGVIRNHIISTENGLPDNIVRVIKPIPGKNEYWIGTQQGGVTIYNADQQKLKNLPTTEAWAWGQINDILPITAKKAWIATEEGYLIEATIGPYDELTLKPCYYPDKKFNALLLDKSGNIWCATNKGLSMSTSEYLTGIALPLPFTLADVTAITCDKNNTIWLAIRNSLYKILPQEKNKLQYSSKSNAPISVLYCDEENTLWIGTSGDGLWQKKENSAIGQLVALAGENILSVTTTRNSLWVSSLNGVKEFRMNLPSGNMELVKVHNKQSGIGSDYIYQLYTDSKESIWMATDGAGICMYDGKDYHHWKNFSTANTNVVYSITEDSYKNIWAGTIFKDLFRYTKGSWQNTREKEIQDIDLNVSTLNANATGQLIAVYQRCIEVWYPGSQCFRHFNNRQGLGIDSTSALLNCSTRDQAGNVYVPYAKGLLLFLNQSSLFDIKPGINIQRITNNLKETTQDDKEYGPDENYLSFYFDGISFTNPERLNYRYKLEGYSENWIYTSETTATFPKLPSGKFRFKVQAALNGNFTEANEAGYSFLIATPFWKQTWFIIMIAMLMIGFIYGFIKFRDRKMQRLAQLEQERVLFDYEHLKSQVNPHFLFNSLNTLTSLIEDNQADAVAYTEKLSDLYRNMLMYHNKDLISLEEEWQLLSSYLHIQQSRFGPALQIHRNIFTQTDKQKKIPPMALQLLVENAIKHNIVSKSSPLIIVLIASEHEITVSNKIKPKITPELESGIGLNNISNRYRLLTDKKVFYGRQGEDWVVKLPLL